MDDNKNIEYLDKPINIKVFFNKPDPSNPQPITYNHYGVIAKEKTGNWLRLIKNNGMEALVNLDNVNQIVTI